MLKLTMLYRFYRRWRWGRYLRSHGGFKGFKLPGHNKNLPTYFPIKLYRSNSQFSYEKYIAELNGFDDAFGRTPDEAVVNLKQQLFYKRISLLEKCEEGILLTKKEHRQLTLLLTRYKDLS